MTTAALLGQLREKVEAALVDGGDQYADQLATVMAAIGPVVEHAAEAASGSHEGVRLWMLDCGELVAKHRGRAEAAEAKLAAIAEHCRSRPELAGAGMPQLAADILAIIGGEEESRG